MAELDAISINDRAPFLRAMDCAGEIERYARRFPDMRDPQGYVSFMACDPQGSILSYRWRFDANEKNGARECKLRIDSLPVYGDPHSETMTIMGVGPDADGNIYASSTHNKVGPVGDSSLDLQQAFAREAEVMLSALRSAVECRAAEL